MQITVNIPDELAAELAAQLQPSGVALETYVEQLVADQVTHKETETSGKNADLSKFFAEMSAGTEGLPLPPESAFTRESFYSDRD